MTKEVKISCDSCGKDITSTGGIPGFRLHLASEILPMREGPVAAVLVYPDIDNDMYFCDLRCLADWVGKNQCLNSP